MIKNKFFISLLLLSFFGYAKPKKEFIKTPNDALLAFYQLMLTNKNFTEDEALKIINNLKEAMALCNNIVYITMQISQKYDSDKKNDPKKIKKEIAQNIDNVIAQFVKERAQKNDKSDIDSEIARLKNDCEQCLPYLQIAQKLQLKAFEKQLLMEWSSQGKLQPKKNDDELNDKEDISIKFKKHSDKK